MPFTIEREKMIRNDSGRFGIRYLEMDLEKTVLRNRAANGSKGSRISTLWSHRIFDAGVTMHYLSIYTECTKLGLVRNILSKAIKLSSVVNMKLALEKWFDYLIKNKYPIWTLCMIADEACTSSEYSNAQRKAFKKALRVYKQNNGISQSVSNRRTDRRKKGKFTRDCTDAGTDSKNKGLSVHMDSLGRSWKIAWKATSPV